MAIGKYKTNQSLVNTGFNQVSGGTLTLSGNTIIANSGTFKYLSDMSGTYTARSVVDAAYVTGHTSSIDHVGLAGQIIYSRGISGITGATGFIYNKATSGVTVPNLCISQTPITDLTADYLLSWDSSTSQVKKIAFSGACGLNAGCNGLTSASGVVCLGGNLCLDTTICGLDVYSLRLCNLCGFCTITTANNIVLDTRNYSGGIYLKSQGGAVTAPSNFTNAIGIEMNYQTCCLKIHDNRVGACQKGVEYAADYSTFYSQRSLVDKAYVDAVAAGLQPHPAVDVATTGNTSLTGLTGTTIIDGVIVNQGNRVLVKNQIDAKFNGIYYLTGSTLVRAGDFDESTESIHGAYTFVLSGETNGNTSWVLSTPNPITIGVTPLNFTLFSQVTDIIAGTGITINKYFGQNTISVDGPNLAGNLMNWNTSTCKFDVFTTGNTYNLASPAAITVGGISGGTVLTGKTAFQLFEELLVPELFGVITAPSIIIGLSSGSTYEVGRVISQTVTGTFNQGCINPSYCSISDKRSGDANAYCFTGCGMPSGFQSCSLLIAVQTNGTYIISAGTQTWGVCTRYDAGSPALGSKGTQYCAALTSGCTAAACSSVTGLYPYYYGKVTCATRPAVTNILVTGGTKAVASSTGTVTVTFSSVGQWTWLAIPQISTSKTCWFVNSLDNGRINNAPSDKYPDECVFSICSGQGCWTAINYKVYVSGFAATDASAIQFRNS